MSDLTNICNTAQVRSNNMEIIKKALKELPYGTKNTVSKITGLSVATCNTLLNELAQTGEIIEVSDKAGDCVVGRPAKAYCFNKDYAHILCMYATTIGGERELHYGVMDLLGQTLEDDVLERELIDYQEIENAVASLIRRYPQIRAIGFGVPGIVNRDMKVEACDIEALNECPLRERLSEHFGVEVVVDNDMNLIAYGFHQEEQLAEDSSLALVSFFDQVCAGCGIIINGTIFHGSTNFAGEVSYLPLGADHEEQVHLLRSREGVLELAAKTISSLAAVINPTQIILTGSPVHANMLDDLSAICETWTPKQHIPKLRYFSDIDDYYLKGLCALTLEHTKLD